MLPRLHRRSPATHNTLTIEYGRVPISSIAQHFCWHYFLTIVKPAASSAGLITYRRERAARRPNTKFQFASSDSNAKNVRDQHNMIGRRRSSKERFGAVFPLRAQNFAEDQRLSKKWHCNYLLHHWPRRLVWRTKRLQRQRQRAR